MVKLAPCAMRVAVSRPTCLPVLPATASATSRHAAFPGPTWPGSASVGPRHRRTCPVHEPACWRLPRRRSHDRMSGRIAMGAVRCFIAAMGNLYSVTTGQSAIPMQLPDEVAAALGAGESYSFADWPNANVSQFGAGVYTIWDAQERFIYVGRSGRSITEQTARRNSPRGLYTWRATPAGAGAAISSVSTWRTGSCCRRCRRATSPRSAPASTRWMRSSGASFTRTCAIGS